MKVLFQDRIGNTIEYFKRYLPYIAQIAQVQDANEIPKALNEFKPDLMILQSNLIDNVVKAYCDQNKAKVIAYGKPSENADINIVINEYLTHANAYPDAPRPQLHTLTFLDESKEKKDISVFVGRENEALFANFLAKNYNVKIYGNVKIASPKYLGMISEEEKYEIINKSKIVIDLGAYHFHDATLLGAYSIIYTDMDLPHYFTTFDNLVSLSSQIEFATNIENRSILDSNMIHLKNQCYHNNDLSFVITTLNSIGFKDEAEKLIAILNNILEYAK